MIEKTQILDENSMSRIISRISFEIIERNKGVDNICIIGIKSRGEFIAYRIAEKIKLVENTTVPVGSLDITNFRDDVKLDNHIDKSDIAFEVKNKKIILVDDVVFTGRSARAAMEAVLSRGRPKNIQLAVIIDRGHRELPIRADYVGKNLPTSKDEIVKVMVKEADGCDKAVILTN